MIKYYVNFSTETPEMIGGVEHGITEWLGVSLLFETKEEAQRYIKIIEWNKYNGGYEDIKVYRFTRENRTMTVKTYTVNTKDIYGMKVETTETTDEEMKKTYKGFENFTNSRVRCDLYDWTWEK